MRGGSVLRRPAPDDLLVAGMSYATGQPVMDPYRISHLYPCRLPASSRFIHVEPDEST